MIYLKRGTDEPAAVEDEMRAARLEARGYTRCTPAQHRAAWRERDAAAYLRIRGEDLLSWLARQDAPAPTVEAWKAPWVLMPIPKE